MKKQQMTSPRRAKASDDNAEVTFLRELVARDELLQREKMAAAAGSRVLRQQPDTADQKVSRIRGPRAAPAARRGRTAAEITPALLELYTRAMQRSPSRPVVSLLLGRACGGCSLRIEPRLTVRIHDVGYVACPHCSRIIVAPKPEVPSQP